MVDEPGSNTVLHWSTDSEKKKSEGKVTTYKFYNYTSGDIHHTIIRNLKFNTKYYYVAGIGHTERQFWFITPPEVGPDVPYTFGLIGDLGQTYDSNATLTHYELNPQKGQAVLFVGNMQISTQIMIMSGGIHGEDSPREVLLINLGYGLQGIMILILPQKLYYHPDDDSTSAQHY